MVFVRLYRTEALTNRETGSVAAIHSTRLSNTVPRLKEMWCLPAASTSLRAELPVSFIKEAPTSGSRI